jgi:hypothetical protein
MNYDEYRSAYFTHPTPKPRYHFNGTFGVTLYEPIRSCPVRDPFGTEILIISPLKSEKPRR